MKKIPISDVKSDQILVLAVYKCAGDNSYADAEDIAVAADNLVKGKFRWKKYKKYIDLYLIKTLLANARDRDKVILGGKDGWKLSAKGKKILEGLKGKISYSGTRLERRSKFDKEKILFEMNRIESSDAFQKYLSNKEPSDTEIKKIFRIDEYSSEESTQENINRLLRLMKGKEVIYRFLKEIRKEVNNEGNSEIWI